MTLEAKQKPVHQVRFGNVRVAIWANRNEKGDTYHSFSLERSYRNRNGDWQSQQISLGAGDVAKVTHALNTAYADFYTMPDIRGDYENSTDAAPKPELTP